MRRGLPFNERPDLTLVEARDSRPRFDSGSIIVPEARDRLLEIFRRRQTPTEAHQTLDGTFSGDLTHQQLMFQAMIDTWPMLQKCLGEVMRAARRAPWKVLPFARRGDDPSKPAEALAKEVEGAIWSMKPDAARGRMGLEKTIEQLALGYYLGHHVLEVDYQLDESGYSPQSTKIVPPRFYGYPYDERGEDRLMLDRSGQGIMNKFEDFPEYRFLLAVNGGHPGHPTVSAPLRALVGYWMAAVYGLKWFLGYAQVFGQPVRWATYAEGDATAKAEVIRMMENIGANMWAALPTGADLKMVGNTQSGASLPQRELIKLADEQCQIMILGQSLTSSVGDSGSRALGDVHMEVRQDVIEGVCDFVGEILSHQFSPAIVALNYGDSRKDVPGIWAVFESPKDEKAMAERDVALGVGERVPVSKQWYYERHGIPIPADGEELFQPTPDGPQGDPASGKTEPHETKDELDIKVEEVQAADAITWQKFSGSAKSLHIPRSEMPQIASSNRGAMVSFLRARGIESRSEEVDAESLKPTQAEYSPEKVKAAKEYKGGNRSILISEDNHVVDGHHQWLAAGRGKIKVIRLMAPISRVLMMAHRMPSTKVAAADSVMPDTVDRLSANVLEGLTGVTKEWLAPVRPVFNRLAALAMSNNVSDDDFIAAVEKAQREMPELFDRLNSQALQTAFEKAISSGLIAGSTSRYEP